MRTIDQAYIDGFHCPRCEVEAMDPNAGTSCDDNAAHKLCADHTITRDEYLTDKAGL